MRKSKSTIWFHFSWSGEVRIQASEKRRRQVGVWKGEVGQVRWIETWLWNTADWTLISVPPPFEVCSPTVAQCLPRFTSLPWIQVFDKGVAGTSCPHSPFLRSPDQVSKMWSRKSQVDQRWTDRDKVCLSPVNFEVLEPTIRSINILLNESCQKDSLIWMKIASLTAIKKTTSDCNRKLFPFLPIVWTSSMTDFRTKMGVLNLQANLKFIRFRCMAKYSVELSVYYMLLNVNYSIYFFVSRDAELLFPSFKTANIQKGC